MSSPQTPDEWSFYLDKLPWHKRLRWRMILPQFLVVLVGVLVMIFITDIILRTIPLLIRPYLVALAENPAQIGEVEGAILDALRVRFWLALMIAAVFALSIGVVTAFILWRIIIAPLQQVSRSSQRIANGRYQERVAVPTNSGEAMARLVLSFNQMATALEQTEQQRVALLSNVTHELRTPLTGLRGYLEGMIDGLFPANEETYAWMSTEIERLQRLVNDIQNLSRIEAGQITLDFQPISLDKLVQRIILVLQPEANGQQINLTYLPPAELPVWVQADADRTTQIIINLVGNGLRYTPPGGRVQVSVAKVEETAVVRIIDTGMGISRESLPYLFERFYRVEKSRSREAGGLGIGLTISRHLAWAMGGELTADSAGEGQGSTFTLTLPLTPPPQINGA